MRRPEIRSFADVSALYLGLALLGLGFFTGGLALVFQFPLLIAFKGGVVTGLILCVCHFVARYRWRGVLVILAVIGLAFLVYRLTTGCNPGAYPTRGKLGGVICCEYGCVCD